MQNQAFNEWAEYSKKGVGLAKHLSDIQFNLFANLSRQQADMLSICLDSSAKQLEILGSAKAGKDMFSAQTRLAEEVGKKVLNNAVVTTEMLTDTAQQLGGWMEKGLEVARSASPAKAAAH